MVYVLLEEHIKFFEEHGYITFENMLKDEELKLLQKELTIEKAYKKDLYKDNDSLKKIALKKNFGSIVFSLTKRRPIRIGYDTFSTPQEPLYTENEFSIESISSLSKTLVAAIFPLSPEPSFYEEMALSGTFFDAKRELDFSLFEKESFYVIVYTENKCRYIFNERDKNTHYLKKLNYSYNDVLQDTSHPIVYR